MDNFAISDVFHTPWDVGYTAVVYTDCPCHLTAYWTDIAPQRHRTARIVRGLESLWGAYWCFDSFIPVEQTELGDTLFHTFEFPTITEGQTIYWACKGTIAGTDSPSVSCIFEFTHPGGEPRTITLRPCATGMFNSIPNQYGAPPPDHWQNVKEVIPDEDATCVMTWYPPVTHEDLDTYLITPLSPLILNIKSVSEILRVRRDGGYAYFPAFRFAIRTHDVIYQSPQQAYINDTYDDYSISYPLNPFTLERWTNLEINALQAGVVVITYWGVGTHSSGMCTQVYINIERNPNGIPFTPRI